jgi:hypothetical protein
LRQLAASLVYFALEQPQVSHWQGWHWQLSPQAQRATFCPAHPQRVFWQPHSF